MPHDAFPFYLDTIRNRERAHRARKFMEQIFYNVDFSVRPCSDGWQLRASRKLAPRADRLLRAFLFAVER